MGTTLPSVGVLRNRFLPQWEASRSHGAGASPHPHTLLSVFLPAVGTQVQTSFILRF